MNVPVMMRIAGGVVAGNGNSGSFNNRGVNGNLWSSSESGLNAWNRNVNSSETRVNRNANDKANGFSVRCLKDSFRHPSRVCVAGVRRYE